MPPLELDQWSGGGGGGSVAPAGFAAVWAL